MFSNHFNWPRSGRQLPEDPLLMREFKESGRGGVVGGDSRPGAPAAAEASGREGGRTVKPRVTDLSELLFVSSSPALRCSVSALSDRCAGGALQ